MPKVTYQYRVHVNRRPPPPVNPFVRLMVGVGSVLALGLAAFLGFFVFLAVVGVVLVGGAVLAVRLWFFKRQIERAFVDAGKEMGARDDGYIDAEYVERRGPGEK